MVFDWLVYSFSVYIYIMSCMVFCLVFDCLACLLLSSYAKLRGVSSYLRIVFAICRLLIDYLCLVLSYDLVLSCLVLSCLTRLVLPYDLV
jgi:hypothetical protein